MFRGFINEIDQIVMAHNIHVLVLLPCFCLARSMRWYPGLFKIVFVVQTGKGSVQISGAYIGA